MLIRQATTNLVGFLFHPTSGPTMKRGPKGKFDFKLIMAECFVILISCLLVNLVFTSIADWIAPFLSNGRCLPKPTEQIESFEKSVSTNFIMVVMAVFVGPVVEELGYRFSLRISPLRVFVSSWIMSFYTFGLFYAYKGLTLLDTLPWLAASFLTAGLLSLFVNRYFSRAVRLRKYWIFVCAFLFAIAHLGNIKLDPVYIPVYIFQFFPYFFFALGFSYLRIRYGIYYSIGLHMTNNFLGVLLINMESLL